MTGNGCEHLVRDGICGANITVCCVYQNCHKYMMNDPHWKDIHSLHETFCDYPHETSDKDYAKAIRDLANFVKEKLNGQI